MVGGVKTDPNIKILEKNFKNLLTIGFISYQINKKKIILTMNQQDQEIDLFVPNEQPNEIAELKGMMVNLIQIFEAKMADLDDKLKSLQETNSKLVHQNISLTSPTNKGRSFGSQKEASKSPSNRSTGIQIEEIDGNLVMSGNTFAAKDFIKQVEGADWNKKFKGKWSVPIDCKDQLIELFNQFSIGYQLV